MKSTDQILAYLEDGQSRFIYQKRVEYVEFPQWLIDKVEDGRVTLTTFSDVIRAALLYKYGGIWLDSTILLTEALPTAFWDYDIFTIREFRYCLPFMGGKPGQKFYRFLMEGFFYYYTYGKI